MGFSPKYFDFSSVEVSCATESLGEREKSRRALTLDFMIRRHDGMQGKRCFKNKFAFFRSYRDYSNSLSLSWKQANPPGVEFLRTITKLRNRCRARTKRQRNIQKSEMHVQSSCNAYWYCCFWRSRCRRVVGSLSPHIQEARASAEKRDVLTFLVTRRVYCASSNIRVCCN